MKILIKILIGMGILIFIILWMTIPYLIEKPVVTVDYFTQYNDLTRPDNYIDEDNAAIALKSLPVPKSATAHSGIERPDFLWSYEPLDYPDKFTANEINLFKEWINQYTPTLEAIYKISQKPYYYQPVDVSQYRDELLENHFYDIDEYMNFSRYEIQELLKWAIVFHLNENDSSKTIEYSKALLAFDKFFSSTGEAYAYYELIDLIEFLDIKMLHLEKPAAYSTETLLMLQTILMNVEFEIDNEYSVQEIGFLDTVQKLFTKGDRGHLSAVALIQNDIGHLSFDDTPSIITCMYKSFRCEHRKETVARMESILMKLREWSGQSLYQLHQQDIKVNEELIQSMAANNYIIQEYLLPMLHMPFYSEQLTCRAHATATIIAIFRFYHNRREYPESLETLLQDGYIDRLPEDPYSGGPLVYRKDLNDFTLYSLGVDFEDDGGRPSVCKNCGNHLTDWGDGPVYYPPGQQVPQPKDPQKDAEGDHVFWPIIEMKEIPSSPFSIVE